MRPFTFLLLNLVSFAANAEAEYETFLSKADLQKLEMRAPKTTTVRDFWQTKAGRIIRCENGQCSVSCEIKQDMDAPEKPVEKPSLGCWLGLRPAHLKTYLALIAKAKQTNSPQVDPERIATCDAFGCVIKTAK